MHKQRTEQFLARLEEAGVPGALVHKPSNMRWLSGYTGEGLVIAAKGMRAIVTDFRYAEQAGRQAPGYAVYTVGPEVTAEMIVAELVHKAGMESLAFEDDKVTVKGMTSLQEAMRGVRFVPVNREIEKLRAVKDDTEIARIEKACGITSQAFEHILGFLKPGVTEKEARFELESAMYRFGAEGAAFDTIVAAGANGSLPHAIPGDRPIAAGDMVTMDFGAKVEGYCADMTRTVAIGKIDDAKRHVYDTVLEAQLRALDAIRPGARCRAIDAIARDFIYQAGYEGCFGHGLGHSLGLDIHEDPRFSATSDAVLEKGIVITDEPGVYLPGECGCRIEDTVLVTEDGCRRLTLAAKELIIL
ncbi:MAG: Xaa-Pro peptidase family protein [Firmicutes bacterium]|nr:Xaa-Pro peptidase family protein [Bacillota bacterium]